jgi:hypothetical protein
VLGDWGGRGESPRWVSEANEHEERKWETDEQWRRDEAVVRTQIASFAGAAAEALFPERQDSIFSLPRHL